LKTNIEGRAVELAEYIVENRATVRAAAKRFGISKSTVHMVVTNKSCPYEKGGERCIFLGKM